MRFSISIAAALSLLPIGLACETQVVVRPAPTPEDIGLPNPDAPPEKGNVGPIDQNEGTPSACTDNPYEQNDSLDKAFVSTLGVEVSGMLCQGDDDWYVFQVPKGCAPTVSMHFEHDRGDLDLELVALDGTVLDESEDLTDDEYVAIDGKEGGQFAAHVRPYQSAQNTYVLQIDQACGSVEPDPTHPDPVEPTEPTQPEPTPPGPVACADDAFEPNETVGRTITLDESVNAMMCGANATDMFQVIAESGCEISASLDFDGHAADLDLELMDFAGNVIASSAGTGDLEHVYLVVDVRGPYSVRVKSYNGNDAAYQITLHTACVEDFVCPTDDALEPSDGFESAHDLESDGAALGMTCGHNDDYYQVEVATGCEAQVDIDFSHQDGDIDAQLFSSANLLVGESTSASDHEQLHVSPGTFYVRVFGYNDAENGYRVDVTTTCD